MRSPGFTIAAVLTLALGIGAATAVFSVVNTVLLEPLPYRDSDRLVRIVRTGGPREPQRPAPAPDRHVVGGNDGVAEGQHDAVGDGVQHHAADHVDADVRRLRAIDRRAGVGEHASRCSAPRARLGRTLDAADEAAGSNVVVISTGAWQRYFQGDPGILGRTITLKTLGPEAGFLDGTPLTIVGVMPASFDFPIPNADYWAPITEGLAGPQAARRRRHRAACRRARPWQAATDEANAIGDGLRPKPTSGPLSRPLPPGERRFAVEGVKEQIVAASRPALRVIAIAVGAVLLIVCANVASLLLARGTARQREVAVRLAIGASRGRILRQFITESLVLAAIGGVLGAVLAVGFVYLLREFASPHAQGVFQLSFGGVDAAAAA